MRGPEARALARRAVRPGRCGALEGRRIADGAAVEAGVFPVEGGEFTFAEFGAQGRGIA